MTATMQQIPRDNEQRLRLSSLMDGELDDATARQTLADLASDPAGRHDWGLWHAAGDALRASEVAAFHSATFAARVSAALADEPVIVAPAAKAPNPHRTVRRIALPGMAAAAAVAALSWVALPMLRGADEPVQQATAQSSAALASDATLPRPAAASAALRSIPPEAVQAVRFDRYVAAHGQMSGTLGLPRTSQYVLRDPVATADDGR
jgi:sigma-E factor negative regulatory protein RseA